MILDELVLHDFGVYGGRQVVTLTPAAPDRPIVLVGGLNGGGKTTLLEALQLCLYGPAASCVDRTTGGYEANLKRRIHRRPGVRAAGIELAFRHTVGGAEHAWRVCRNWALSSSGACRESLEVFRNGELDKLATENWAEQVEEFLPGRISRLFLFDGEKVESYADPEEAPALISTAIQSLLGLDVVERLSADLATLEKRKKADRPDEGGIREAESARAKLHQLENERAELQRREAECNDVVDRARRDLRAAEDRFRREGGELYERRGQLESTMASASRSVAETKRELLERASLATPLLLVQDILGSMLERNRQERNGARSGEVAKMLEREHEAILEMAEFEQIPDAARLSIREAFIRRRTVLNEAARRPVVLELDRDASSQLEALMGSELKETSELASGSLDRARAARRALDDAERAMAAAPAGGEMEQLASLRDELRLSAAKAEGDLAATLAALESTDRDLAAHREREARLAEAEALERFKGEDVERTLVHSARVRGTLIRFREAVVERHAERIAGLILECFQRLVRKPNLLSGLKIDPATFRLDLMGGNELPLKPEQLSAGERQLLAIAMLWGLARASGRPLPTVIDTPLGRLDSRHRLKLIDRYFPHASHQVVLLSTDEEIAGGYHDRLRQWIGRSYRLEFDEDAGGTVISEGYIDDPEVRNVA